MRVILVNGSPRERGCTYTALAEAAAALAADGLETEIFHLGAAPLGGCKACGACWKLGKCVIDGDAVNLFLDKAESADGFIFGSPVHYAAPTGPMTTFMHRMAYAGGERLRGKPGAAVVSCRRAGSTAALDQLNKYFPILGMPMAPTQYWPMVHGANPEDVKQDLEGLQTMRLLGHNLAWLIKCIAAGKAAGIPLPEREERAWTNFIR